MKESYTQQFKRDLEKDLISETGGHLKRVFVSLVQGNRPEGSHTDPVKAAEDVRMGGVWGLARRGSWVGAPTAAVCFWGCWQARALFEAGEKVWLCLIVMEGITAFIVFGCCCLSCAAQAWGTDESEFNRVSGRGAHLLSFPCDKASLLRL